MPTVELYVCKTAKGQDQQACPVLCFSQLVNWPQHMLESCYLTIFRVVNF